MCLDGRYMFVLWAIEFSPRGSGPGAATRRSDTANARSDRRSVPCRTARLALRRPAVLVETLLDRGADGDVAEAEAAIERLAAAPADEGW